MHELGEQQQELEWNRRITHIMNMKPNDGPIFGAGSSFANLAAKGAAHGAGDKGGGHHGKGGGGGHHDKGGGKGHGKKK